MNRERQIENKQRQFEKIVVLGFVDYMLYVCLICLTMNCSANVTEGLLMVKKAVNSLKHYV